MTERMISNRIRKLKELENQRAELEKQIELKNNEIRIKESEINQIKNEMDILKQQTIPKDEYISLQTQFESELNADMDSKGLEEQKVGDYVVRFITVVTNRFDSSRLKKEHADLYSRYLKETSSRRFTVA